MKIISKERSALKTRYRQLKVIYCHFQKLKDFDVSYIKRVKSRLVAFPEIGSCHRIFISRGSLSIYVVAHYRKLKFDSSRLNLQERLQHVDH